MSTDLAAQAASANNAILSDPAPHIDQPGSVKVELLRGLLMPNSEAWQTTATVRELTGADEEALSAYDVRNDVTYSEYMSQLLKRAVVKIGEIEVADNVEIVDKLIIGDRDVLFMGIIKATYGRYREFDVTCRECEGKNSITVDLEKDFPIDEAKEDIHKNMSVTLKNGTVVELSYPTGADSQAVSKKAKTTAEQNTIMLARCAVLDDKNPTKAEAWARGLSLADRNKLVKVLLSAQPGPRMEEVKTQCAHCNANIVLALDWVSLLFG